MKEVLAGLLVLMAAGPATAEPVNHCHDKKTNQKWKEIAAENHEVDAIQRLYALRLGLCFQVEKGILTVPRATRIFERQREEVIRQLKEHSPQRGQAL